MTFLFALISWFFPTTTAPVAVSATPPTPPAIVTPAISEQSQPPTVRPPHIVSTPSPKPRPTAAPTPAPVQAGGVRTVANPSCPADSVSQVDINGVTYPECMTVAAGSTFTCVTYNADGTWDYSEPTAPRVCPDGTFGSMVVK